MWGLSAGQSGTAAWARVSLEEEYNGSASRLSKYHKIYTSIVSDQKHYHKEMRKTTNEFKLPLYYAKAKMACSPFSTISHLNVFIFLQINPRPLTSIYPTIYVKIPTVLKFSQKLQQFTKAVLMMLVIFRMSVQLFLFSVNDSIYQSFPLQWEAVMALWGIFWLSAGQSGQLPGVGWHWRIH